MATLFGIIGSARLGSARLGSALSVTLALLALALLLSIPPAAAQTSVDYDDDNDRLIEIDTPAQLNAIRHDLSGAGTATHAVYTAADAFPNAAANQCDDPATTGATETCAGYELTADLDLSGYANWSPIGGAYTATFEGNGHTISNLTITGNGNDDAGLFGNLSTTGRIYRVGVANANITGTASSSQELGILVGESNGIIRMSYTSGSVTANSSGSFHKTGGLVGRLQGGGQISASYSTATVAGPATAASDQGTGGLVGQLWSGTITAGYATGAVSSGAYAGGLTGQITSSSTVRASYAAGAVSGSSSNIGGLAGVSAGTVENSYHDGQRTGQSGGQATSALRRPTGYTGIYQNWNVNVDGAAGDDDPWNFGTRRDYPLLQVDFNRDGTPTWEEFGSQYRYIPPPPIPPPYNPAADHPEIYANPRYEMATSCDVQTTGEDGEAISTATLTFDLGDYTRPLTLALSLWDGDVFRSLQSQGISMPELRQEGQTATVEVVTDPAQTRFRLDSEYGLNLVLGYADCHTDDPE